VVTNLGRAVNAIDIREAGAARDLLKSYQPDEIYYLAAYHHSSQDMLADEGELFKKSFDTHVHALVNFLEAMRRVAGFSRLFYAGSSHIFGSPARCPQDEETPYNPNCVYGITKTAGIRACQYYRQRHSLFACAGILYNHESPLRAAKFISKKIVNTALAIKNREKDRLVVGDLGAQIDWGYAPDYVEAMTQIMRLDVPEEFIISSGTRHTVRDFIEGVFDALGLDWRKYVQEDATLITKRRKANLQGDHRKLTAMTGWKPKVTFYGLIQTLVHQEIKARGQEQNTDIYSNL